MPHTLSFNSQTRTVRSKSHLTMRFRRLSLVSCMLGLVLAANLGWAAPPQALAKGERDKAGATRSPSVTDELNKYPGLLDEYVRLMTRFQREIKLPPVRSHSSLLRLMPQSTIAYGAFPNYGVPAHQALDIFQDELKSSAPLRDWWQHVQASSKGPNAETLLKRYYQLSEYLGDEVVASGTIKGNGGGGLLLAEVKKPGVEEFLRSTVKELAGKSTPPLVLNPNQLATAQGPNNLPVILVRPDLVIFSSDLKTLRDFNSKLGNGEPTLDSTDFGKRLTESYQRGVGILTALDLQPIFGQMPKGRSDDNLFLQRSGLADAKYAIWEYAEVPGQAPSQSELSFVGPRRGIASWLAASSHLSGLDFVSPDAALVMSVLLKNPTEIFSDIKELSSSSAQSKQNLANLEPVLMPILSQLTGDITLELDSFTPASAEWKMILGTRDVNALQQSLSPILARLQPRETTQDGETYYVLQIPNANKPMTVSYSFQQGYLVVGSSQQTVVKAVLAHRAGESLGNSEKYRAALPLGHSDAASAIMYQNSTGFLKAMLSRLPPEIMQGFLQPSSAQSPSVVNAVYGEETVIRQASSSGASSVAPALIIAAIAIPNLLRSRIAANEASAVGSIRSMNTAQVVYASTYPQRGFARDLATLGSGSSKGAPSAAHAQFLDSALGCSSGTAGNWCTKSGYKFTIRTNCTQQRCGQFVAVATPVSTSTGLRSFCSTADGVIRLKTGPPLTSVISASECKSWQTLQ
jgi:type IV pilus assembly protein PilA